MGVPQVEPPLLDLVCGDATSHDPSSPLSAADLQACLDRIRLRSDEVKEKVYKVLTSHHRDFLATMTRAGETSSDVATVEAELAVALALLPRGVDGRQACSDVPKWKSFQRVCRQPQQWLEHVHGSVLFHHFVSNPPTEGPSFCIEILASASELRQLKTELEAKQAAIEALQTISSFHKRLVDLEQHISGGQFLEAANQAVELEAVVEALPGARGQGDAEGGVRVFQLMRGEFDRLLEKLKALLEDLTSQALSVNPKQGELRIRTQVPNGGSEVPLSQLFDALERLKLLNARLFSFGDVLFSAVLDPLLHNASLKLQIETAGKGRGATVRWSTQEKSRELPTAAEVYPKILTLVKFLRRHLMEGQDERMLQLGRILWPRLADALLAGPLGKAVPSEIPDLITFQEVASLTASFEAALVAERFSPSEEEEKHRPPSDRTSPHRLSLFASNVDLHFAAKKRQKLLTKARGLLLQPDWCYNTVTGGGGASQKSTPPPGW